MIFADSARPRDGRPAVNGLKEALQIRKRSEGIISALAHPRGAVEPTPGRHVGDRILIADDEIPALQVVVENLVMALRLPAVAIHRIVEALGRSELEMHGLAGKWTQTGSDEEQPGEELGPILRFADELAGLFGQIDQDRRRIENPRFYATRSVGIDDHRHLAVRVDGAKSWRVLFTLAGVDRDHLVGQPRLFQKERDLCGIGRRMEIEVDHEVSRGFSRAGEAMACGQIRSHGF